MPECGPEAESSSRTVEPTVEDELLQFILGQLPRPRGNVLISNRQVLAALLYVRQSGCSWRQLPPEFGNWHTLYTRVRRWYGNDALRRVLQLLPGKDGNASADGPSEDHIFELADRLNESTFQLMRCLRNELAGLPVSSYDVMMVMVIKSNPGISLSALAAILNVRTVTASVAVRHLREIGWVLAMPDASDRRGICLSITAQGFKALSRIRHARAGQIAKRLKSMPAEDIVHLETFLPSWERLISAFE